MRPGLVFGLIEATSNVGESAAGATICAARRGDVTIPIATGMAIAATSAAPRTTRFSALSATCASFFMICSTRFLRSEPVTPATHTSGDST